jgi:predicted hydrocarbon binding protein
MPRTFYDVLSDELDARAGPDARKEIMQGSDEAAASKNKRKEAEWARGAMQRVDSLVDETTRALVMEQCGRNCAWRGRAEKIRKMRKKCRTMDEFYAGLVDVLRTGVPLERDGSVVYASYPRCYCGRVSDTKEPISMTYCHCGRGYWVAMFEHALGKPVHVDLLQSVIGGAPTCRFAIHIPEEEFA